MKHDEAQPISKGVRAVRWLYYASMAVGFPLWLLIAFILISLVCLIVSPIPDIGPVEFQAPSNTQVALLRAAGIAFFLGYSAAFLWAYRITRHPWVVFAIMLLPVLAFCYAVEYFPITDSNAEKRTWLIYLGSLAFFLVTGAIVAAVQGRNHSPTRQNSHV